MRGENGGFDGETFQKAGELFKQFVDLQPFQTGFLGFKNQQAVGYFGDGKAAMTLAISTTSTCSSACWRPTRQVSATTSWAGSPSLRLRRQGRCRATRSAASPAG